MTSIPMKSKYHHKFILTIIATTIGLSSIGLAAKVIWQSTPGSTDITSVGDHFDSAVSFEMGTFQVGFTPTMENIAQWASNWAVIDRTTYNPETKFFASSVTFLSNEAPYTKGRKVYMWGSTGGRVPEWILATNEEWEWPGADLAFPRKWNIATASTVVVGQLSDVGGPFLMRTAAVNGAVGASLNAEQWLAQHFGENEPVDTLHLDPDGDGRDNMLEMALGTDPMVPEVEGSVPYTVDLVRVGEFDFLRLTVSKQAIQQLKYRVEVSVNLVDWVTGSLNTSVLVDNVSMLSVRDNVAFEVGHSRFIRLTVER